MPIHHGTRAGSCSRSHDSARRRAGRARSPSGATNAIAHTRARQARRSTPRPARGRGEASSRAACRARQGPTRRAPRIGQHASAERGAGAGRDQQRREHDAERIGLMVRGTSRSGAAARFRSARSPGRCSRTAAARRRSSLVRCSRAAAERQQDQQQREHQDRAEHASRAPDMRAPSRPQAVVR